jgi:hypothetical protein
MTAAPIKIGFIRGPSPDERWTKMGFVPADRLEGSFPASLLPGIVEVEAHTKLPTGRMLVIHLQVDDITEDELMGASLCRGDRSGSAATVVTRADARARLEHWLRLSPQETVAREQARA